MSVSDTIRKKARRFCSAVVVAAGSSERMGRDKLMLELSGVPILARTLTALERCECIDEIIVVTQPEKIPEVALLCRQYGIDKATKVLSGGATRPESSLAGVCEISPKAKLVAIHDAARPLITEELVTEVVHMAALHKAAAPGIALKDTVKLVSSNQVELTPERESARAVQTPQVFEPDIIKGALSYVIQNEIAVTDDCSAVEALGVPVRVTEGSEENIKITTPLDISLAEAILEKRGDPL